MINVFKNDCFPSVIIVCHPWSIIQFLEFVCSCKTPDRWLPGPSHPFRHFRMSAAHRPPWCGNICANIRLGCFTWRGIGCHTAEGPSPLWRMFAVTCLKHACAVATSCRGATQWLPAQVAIPVCDRVRDFSNTGYTSCRRYHRTSRGWGSWSRFPWGRDSWNNRRKSTSWFGCQTLCKPGKW